MEQKNNKEMGLIEKYFAYELNDTELDHFDRLYHNDPAFKSSVETYRSAQGYVKEKYFPEGKSLLEEKQKELERLNPNQNRLLRPLFKRLLAAASILLIAALAFWLYNSPNSSTISAPQLALEMAKNTTNYDLLEVKVRSTDDPQKNNLWGAIQAEDWATIIGLTKDLSAEDPALAIKGIAHFHRGEYREALAIFTTAKANNSGIEDNLLWWLSITHLRLGQEVEAKQVLQEIIQKNFPSADRAKAILQELDTPK